MNDGTAILILLGALTWYWHWSRASYEKILSISRAVCKEIDVQFLDDSVSLARISLAFPRQGPTIRRQYRFEFSSNGADRRRGDVMLLGARIEWIRINHPDGDYLVDQPGGRFQ